MVEKIINFVFIYLMTFWIVIFLVLPFGVNRNDKPEQGTDHGAPKNAMMKKKFIATAVITFLLTALYMLLTYYGIIDWERMANGN